MVIKISFKSLLFSVVLPILILSFAFAQDHSGHSKNDGSVYFENSCGDAVAQKFNRAVEMLHSFEYVETDKLFKEILEVNPNCAMARWGIAMGLWHPLWAPPSQATLKKGAAVLAGIDKYKVTRREEGYIQAIKAFYTDYESTSNVVRARIYETEMAKNYRNNLDDPEAAVFYALAIRAVADPKDKEYLKQFKSAGILNWVKKEQPLHPGVLHYIIHDYDYPGIAHLALDEAEIYAAAAPDSAHAQHMPSHIFTRLGLWDKSISSNQHSTASAAAYTERAHLPGHYDEGLHSTDYLMYAYLQTARDQEATDLLKKLKSIGVTNTENFKVAFTLASVPARLALERKNWQEASELELLRENDFGWQEFGWARSIHHFARGVGAARSGQLENAKQELAIINEIKTALSDDTLLYWREEIYVQSDAVTSWIKYAEGNIAEALGLARSAAEREDAVDKHPVTPGEVLPARELYADMLLEIGQYEKALLNYEIDLDRSPNRYNGLLGAAQAAVGAGNKPLAGVYYKKLLDQVSQNTTRDSIEEAKQFLADM